MWVTGLPKGEKIKNGKEAIFEASVVKSIEKLKKFINLRSQGAQGNKQEKQRENHTQEIIATWVRDKYKM